jgi:hypothetical protein
MAEVMPLAEREPAAREAAAPVPVEERTPQRRGNRPGPGPDLQEASVLIVPHHHPAGVARQAPRRFRGNVRPVLEDRLAGLIRVREHRSIDMDHHLVPLSRGAGIELVVQGRFREQSQRVGLLLGHGRRIRRRVSRTVGCLLTPRPLVQRLAGRFECPQEQGADFRRQPPSDNHRAVLVLVHVKRPARVLALGLPGLGLPVHAAPATYDPLDVGGRAGVPHPKEPLFAFLNALATFASKSDSIW